MSQIQYFGDLAFEANFVFAHTSNQEKIKFSKHERALLRYFIARPHMLLTRAMLLECVQNAEADTIDRNIDYLLSRLRRKLGDSARNPQYIATQYGEGYLWIGKPPQAKQASPENVFLSIGPIYGAGTGGDKAVAIDRFTNNLKNTLKDNFGPQRDIRLRPTDTSTLSAEELTAHDNAQYALELSILSVNGRWQCSLIALKRKTGHVFGTFRHELCADYDNAEQVQATAKLSNSIKTTLWESQIFRANEATTMVSDPLSVGMYKASKLFEHDTDNSTEVEKRLRQQLRDNPNDHKAAIMLVTNLNAQYYSADCVVAEDWDQEAELLLFEHLPGIQNDALYLASAADRLYDFGHYELAENLAERALDIGPSFGACYMVVGRMKVHRGSAEEGIAYYQHSLEITEADSLFYIMLKTMIAIAARAIGDQNTVRSTIPYVINMETDDFKKLALSIVFFADDEAFFPTDIAAAAKALPIETATFLMDFLFTIAIKPFSKQEHRENLLRGFVNFFSAIHGDEFAPEAIREALPGLFPNTAVH